MKANHREQIVIDSRGKKVGVLLDFDAYQQLLEDLHDLRVVAERKQNPKISVIQLRSRLKRYGRV